MAVLTTSPFKYSSAITITTRISNANLNIPGSATFGTTSSDGMTFNASAWTMPNAITWIKTQQVGVAETLYTMKVSDSLSTFSLVNATSNIGEFSPNFQSVIEPGKVTSALVFSGTLGTSTTANGATVFLGRYNDGGGGGNQDLGSAQMISVFRNRATDAMYITGGYNLILTSGGTSPSVDGATADRAALASVDRVNTRHTAAGNRTLGIQTEKGSAIYIGDDAIDFVASTAILSVGATDIITMTTTTIALVPKISTYNNIATVSNGVPSELATIDSTGLTANVGASTLYAVPASGAGMYRVSAYVVLTTAASVSSTLPNVQIVFTDKDSNTAVTLDATPILAGAGLGQTGALTGNTVGQVSTGEVALYVKASTTIQYQTINYASSLAGMAYALHIKLEAL